MSRRWEWPLPRARRGWQDGGRASSASSPPLIHLFPGVFVVLMALAEASAETPRQAERGAAVSEAWWACGPACGPLPTAPPRPAVCAPVALAGSAHSGGAGETW